MRALQRAGFDLVHVRGSHHYMRRPGGSRLVVVPVHGNRDLPVGTLRAILRQAELSRDDLLDLLWLRRIAAYVQPSGSRNAHIATLARHSRNGGQIEMGRTEHYANQAAISVEAPGLAV